MPAPVGTPAGIAFIQSLHVWLAVRALPSAPWTPDPSWLALNIPSPALSAHAMATVAALARLRAMALAQFGIDLLQPSQHRAFARLVATLQLRVSAMASVSTPVLQGWANLAALANALRAIEAALAQNLFTLPPEQLALRLMPGGQPMAAWRPFLVSLRGASLLLETGAHLGITMTGDFRAELAAAVAVLRRLTLPGFPGVSGMASLTALLSAAAQLRAAFGGEPLLDGGQAAREQLLQLLRALLASLRVLPPFANAGSVGFRLDASLPALSYSPALFATADTVRAAASIHAEAAAGLNWNVAESLQFQLPALTVGLPACAFAATLQAAAGVQAARAVPCGARCDAIGR